MNNPGVALITGCSSGIGKAAALAFVQAGFATYATARRPETLTGLAAQGCHTLMLDVTDEESMVNAVKTVEQNHGAVSVLVNNAGYGEYGPLEELAMDDVRREFETNVLGLLRMCQLVLPGMRKQTSGHIINISSVGGEMTLPLGGVYHASKYAVEALSDVLRVEVKPFGISVSIIQPGFVRTSFASTVTQSGAISGTTGAYGGLKQNFQKLNQSVENGSMGGSKAEAIAHVIVRAAQSERPRTRYKISLAAYALPTMRRWLSDRMWDGFVSRMIPSKA